MAMQILFPRLARCLGTAVVWGSLLAAPGSALAQDAMFVDPTGNVGVGTNTPSAPLHVTKPTDAEVRVENTSTTTAERVLFRLINNGKTRFSIRNNAAGESWTFDNAGNEFQISRVGTGVAEFRVRGNGDVRMDEGEAFAQAFNTVSSRETKTDFTPVDARTMLEKVAALAVSEWSYKKAPTSERHVGPMAEDFYATFGLGTSRHISLVDFAGVSLSAIKALKVENDALKAELDTLRAEFEALRNQTE